MVTGPNGSGKSNILDGVLFCLGLATSRGMRADRLPDLINSSMLRQGKAAETVVTVRFDLTDWQPDGAEAGLEAPEEGPWIQTGQTSWSVSRRLRVAPGGTYSSSFSADGVPCNLQQLQTQLRRLRVDPEGSNVVMQGDVTRIVSMGARDRRGIIDELAGVALFDSRIEQSRGKLDEVQERQERCSIVQQELLANRQKLERDCAKARTYQDLRNRFQTGRLQEQVLTFEAAQHQFKELGSRQQALTKQQLKLTHFKSFGGSITIPLEEGFTVVTGPNGSGKSNILDGVLFCLGLATSRGMRADRLPDLINSSMLRQGKAAETVVTVRFDLTDWQPDGAEAGLEAPEEGPWIQTGQTSWSVSRRLRVAPGGTYSSSFSADGVPCNLQQLQTQLRRLRVDPEGSNVVMQGDVTRIVSMGARDRRGIIDELAGVALFDSRIEQSRGKLDEVQERQERCSIVQQELLANRQKLERPLKRALPGPMGHLGDKADLTPSP